MSNQNVMKRVGVMVAGAAVLVPAFALAQVQAQTNVDVTAQAQTPAATTAAQTNVSATVATPAMKAAIAKADQEIDRRIAALNDLIGRIGQMTRVSATLKQGLTSNTQGQITALTTLKAKIDAGTDLATLKTDVQSVTSSYRTFALVAPQGRVSASADRVANVTIMMQALGAKLQLRLQAAQTAGNDVTAAAAALNDLGANLSDANTRAQAAINGIAPLTPDNGDATVKATNDKAFKTAQADLKTAQSDLVTGRKDIDVIIKALSTMHAAAAATTTTQTQ
ncbi:MAG: hypothetical protein JWO43_213 [Candidatus Adlerbacteria bacterium]|nr:hypothetical protein [Candidatus Adlerbacteria bacterium]